VTPGQRQALLAYLNAPANVVSDASRPDVPTQALPPHTSTGDAQDVSPDLVTVLGILSDARLTQRERQVVASFTNLLAANPSTAANLTRGNTVSTLPPYST
jgi:hypothetical protein